MNRDETDMMDIIMSKNPTKLGGESPAMFFVGSASSHCDIHKKVKQAKIIQGKVNMCRECFENISFKENLLILMIVIRKH